jgi:hypothetical protein
MHKKKELLGPPLHRKVRRMGYKNLMDLEKYRFSIYIIYIIFIFKVSLKKYHCLFSKTIYLLKHQRVSKFMKRELLQILSTSHRPS